MTTHTIERVSACEKRVKVTVNEKTVKKAIQSTIRSKAGKLNYGGFRPNASVTQNLVAKQITTQEEEAIHQKLCKDSFSSLASKEKFNYQGTPIVESITPLDNGSLSYVVICENYPEIPHVSWEKVTLEKLDTQITDEALSDAIPSFKRMGFVSPMESKETATQWSSWMIEIFQRQKVRDQVIDALLKQNIVNELPQRVIEERYQELQQEHKEDNDFDEDTLHEKARRYITTDILFKAYALEHNIKVDRETFLAKIKEASQNPFITGQIKDQSLLPYYLAPRISEDAIIDHLVENADCTIKALPLKDFIALAFNQQLEEEYNDTSEENATKTTTTENPTQKEEETK